VQCFPTKSDCSASAQGSPGSGQRESLSLTPKRSQNWANHARTLQSRKEDLRASESSDEDDWPQRARGRGTLSSPRKAAPGVRNKSPARRPQDSTIIPVEGARHSPSERFDPWKSPTIVHSKQQLAPLTPEASPQISAVDSPPADDKINCDPFQARIVTHRKRSIRPVTPEFAAADHTGSTDTITSGCTRVPSIEPIESPWEAPTVVHAKRCLRPVTPEIEPSEGPDDSDIALGSVTPEPPGDPGDCTTAESHAGILRFTADAVTQGLRVEDCAVTQGCRVSDGAVTEVLGRTVDAVSQKVHWLSINDSQDTRTQGLMQAKDDTSHDAGSKWVDASITSPVTEQGLPRMASPTKRSLPQLQGKARVAREISLLIKGSDDEEEESRYRNLDARALTPRVNRVMQGDDSDEEMRARRIRTADVRRKKPNAPQPSSDSPTANWLVPAVAKTGGDASPSKGDEANNVVERRMANVLKPLKSTMWSDDDQDDARPLTGPMRAVSTQDDAREEALEALRSARRLVRLERKAMHLAQGSDSDEEMAPQVALQAATPKRHAIEREIDLRMSGTKFRPSPAASSYASAVSSSVLEAAEREWILVETEDKSEPRPAPTSFGTPLRNKKPIPARRPRAGGDADSPVKRSGTGAGD
jgi:hypothetical protein